MKSRSRIALATIAVAALAGAASAQDTPSDVTPCEGNIEELRAFYKANPPPESHGFPAIPEIEYENSLIVFRVCVRKPDLTPEQEERRKKSWKCCDPEFYDVELVRLDAYMRLCREAPVINELGFRELRFTIERWELFGRWNQLDADLVFSATPDVVQPKSLAFATRPSVPAKCQDRTGGLSNDEECEQYKGPRAMTKASNDDFPAMIIYNAIYDVWLNGRKLVSAEPGIAMARGAMQIPPTAVTVAFQKPVEVALPDGTLIKICPGTCNGMVTIPEHEFWPGIETAERIKSGQLRLPDSWQPAAVKRSPPEPVRPTPSRRRPK